MTFKLLVLTPLLPKGWDCLASAVLAITPRFLCVLSKDSTKLYFQLSHSPVLMHHTPLKENKSLWHRDLFICSFTHLFILTQGLPV